MLGRVEKWKENESWVCLVGEKSERKDNRMDDYFPHLLTKTNHSKLEDRRREYRRGVSQVLHIYKIVHHI